MLTFLTMAAEEPRKPRRREMWLLLTFPTLLLVLVAMLFGGFFLVLGHFWQRGLQQQRERMLDRYADPAALPELADWARTKLGSPIPSGSLRISELPPSAREAGINFLTANADDEQRITTIVLWCGGADNHYGLVVGSSDPPSGWSDLRFELGNGVWFWDELEKIDVADHWASVLADDKP